MSFQCAQAADTSTAAQADVHDACSPPMNFSTPGTHPVLLMCAHPGSPHGQRRRSRRQSARTPARAAQRLSLVPGRSCPARLTCMLHGRPRAFAPLPRSPAPGGRGALRCAIGGARGASCGPKSAKNGRPLKAPDRALTTKSALAGPFGDVRTEAWQNSLAFRFAVGAPDMQGQIRPPN